MWCGLSAQRWPSGLGSVRAFLVKACVVLVSSCLLHVSASLHWHTIAFEPDHQRIVLSDVHRHGSVREFRPGRLSLRQSHDSNTRIQFKQPAASFDDKHPAQHRAARAETDLCHALGWQRPPQGNRDEARQHSWSPPEWQVPQRDVTRALCASAPCNAACSVLQIICALVFKARGRTTAALVAGVSVVPLRFMPLTLLQPASPAPFFCAPQAYCHSAYPPTWRCTLAPLISSFTTTRLRLQSHF
jgi:hypothetical protein